MSSYPDSPQGRMAGPASQRVILHVPVDILVSQDESVPVAGRLVYETGDPFSVALDFPENSSRIARWVFARDLLLEGLVHGVGEGDVQVCPNALEDDALRILLCGSGAWALLELPMHPVRAWLDDTLALVPVGEESAFISWDTELDEVFQRRP